MSNLGILKRWIKTKEMKKKISQVTEVKKKTANTKVLIMLELMTDFMKDGSLKTNGMKL